MLEFELKLAAGKTVVWTGHDGINAAIRYAAAHPGAVIIAYRKPRHGVFPGMPLAIIQ